MCTKHIKASKSAEWLGHLWKVFRSHRYQNEIHPSSCAYLFGFCAITGKKRLFEILSVFLFLFHSKNQSFSSIDIHRLLRLILSEVLRQHSVGRRQLLLALVVKEWRAVAEVARVCPELAGHFWKRAIHPLKMNGECNVIHQRSKMYWQKHTLFVTSNLSLESVHRVIFIRFWPHFLHLAIFCTKQLISFFK